VAVCISYRQRSRGNRKWDDLSRFGLLAIQIGTRRRGSQVAFDSKNSNKSFFSVHMGVTAM
jgi:hypothetical protein